MKNVLHQTMKYKAVSEKSEQLWNILCIWLFVVGAIALKPKSPLFMCMARASHWW